MVKHYSIFCVFYLSVEFVGFYYLPTVKLHLQITRVCTSGVLLSQRFGFISLHMSVATFHRSFYMFQCLESSILYGDTLVHVKVLVGSYFLIGI